MSNAQARGGRRRNARRGPRPASQPSIALVTVPLAPTTITWADEEDGTFSHTLGKPTQAPPLTQITHVQWAMVSTNEVTWLPPNTQRHRVVKSASSNWIPVSDWEDLELTAVARQFIPGTPAVGGAPATPPVWLPPVTRITWQCRGIMV